MAYTKLFSEMLNSTIWAEADHVRIVWITMLCLRDDRHEVMASVPGLAHSARISREKCEDAIKILESPDPDSRSKAHEGRRIEKVSGGWKILNGEFYRAKRNEEERKKYMREYMQKYRSNDVNNVNVNLANVNNVSPEEKRREEHRREEYKSLSSNDEAPREVVFSKNFLLFWNTYPKKVGKMAAWGAWKKAKLGEEIIPILQKQIQSEKWQEQNGRFIPNPSTWINQGRWLDETEVTYQKPILKRVMLGEEP